MSRGRTLLDRLVAWSPVLMLGSLAALTYWLDAQVQPPAPRRDGSTRHDPDLYIEHFRAVSLDAEGRPLQSLAATRAQHFPDDDSIEIAGPSLALTEPGRPRMSVSADAAVVPGSRETVIFTGNVRASRDAAPPTKAGEKGSGPVTLATEYLRVDPREGRAVTDKPVTIEEPRGIIHSVGMELDNKARTLKLKGGVRGTLQPEGLSK
ncbi:MAG: LPS export ABC transporter periplasmic protein LptC [Betaproteobacteria bacterium]